jgi:hypothetical protein
MPLILEWLSGGLANAIASAILNPMDVTKTRMQTLQVSSLHEVKFSVVFRSIFKSEGLLGLWKPGLSASMAREMLYSGPRAGFYVPIRDNLKKIIQNSDQEDLFIVKILSALTTGL